MNRDRVTGNDVVSNFFWNLMERWGAQGVTLIVSIILARLLEPKMYGTTALVTVFTSILGVFIDSGLGSALVQKKDADDLDFSTVFFFNIFMCTVLYAGMFFAAPLIARFYNTEELTTIVRVMSLTLIISGVKNILVSVIQRRLQYKKFFFATLTGTIGAAVIGIVMAYRGFGVWALICQSLFNSTVDTIILWLTVDWRPKLQFSFLRLKSLFSYGWKLLATTLVDKVYSNLRQLLIGKIYSAEDLAYYNKASGWPNLLFVNIGGAADSVLFPVMARAQDNFAEVRYIMGRTIRLNTYVLFPMMAGLAVCSKPAIRLILTEKWLPSAIYMQIFCFSYALNVIENTNKNALRSVGRSDMFLLYGIITKSLDLFALLITIRISVIAMAFSLAVTSFIGLIVLMFIVERVLSLPVLQQIQIILPNALLSGVMGFAVYLVSKVPKGNMTGLMLQIITGAVVYILLSILFRVDSFQYLLNFIKIRLLRKKTRL